MNEISKDIAAERKADRESYLLIAAFVFLSWISISISSQIDAIRAGTGEAALRFWFIQFTSHIVIALLAAMIPVLLSRFPLNPESWKRSLLGLVFGFLIFGCVHVFAMVLLRKLGWPLLFNEPYVFGLDQPLIWFYELQKDAYTFVLMTSIFWLGRHSARQRLEDEGRRIEAKESGRLTLTSGGRVYVVDAEDVRLAKAAANYVEIETPEKSLLVRLTLGELEQLLLAAGDQHVRIHRSCIVRKSDIAEVKPNGDGTASVVLKDGTVRQVSRSYRTPLRIALERDLQVSQLAAKKQ